MIANNDPLWPHFAPLWQALSNLDPSLCIAGGYGLFLKQHSLQTSAEARIVIPFENWLDTTPRATKDFDLVIGLDLIADETANQDLLNILENHDFKVTDEPGGQRWQFIKQLDQHFSVVVELHASTPPANHRLLRSDRVRVKRYPSLQQNGVHGRHNPETIGYDISPYALTIEGLEVTIPNALSLAIMKLTATSERWEKSQIFNETPERRRFSREQAIKHGHDVCRAIAMMTLEERETCQLTLESMRESYAFKRAATIYHAFFVGNNHWADEVLRDYWQATDLSTIHSVLRGWFT